MTYGASGKPDRAGRPTAQAPAGLGDTATIPSASEYPPRRSAYEGTGGWADGRLGQAYDLIAAAITDRGEAFFRHPLLAAVEAYDIEGMSA